MSGYWKMKNSGTMNKQNKSSKNVHVYSMPLPRPVLYHLNPVLRYGLLLGGFTNKLGFISYQSKLSSF